MEMYCEICGYEMLHDGMNWYAGKKTCKCWDEK